MTRHRLRSRTKTAASANTPRYSASSALARVAARKARRSDSDFFEGTELSSNDNDTDSQSSCGDSD